MKWLLAAAMIMVLACSLGCPTGGNETPEEGVAYPVWSEDDSEIAYIWFSYTDGPLYPVVGQTYEDTKWQVRLRNLDGSNDRELGPVFDGFCPWRLNAYNGEQGYALVEEHSFFYWHAGDEARLLMIRQDGVNVLQHVVVEEDFGYADGAACGGRSNFPVSDAIPSPDGTVIAMVDMCANSSWEVRFIDSQSLATLNEVSGPLDATNGWDADYTWMPNNTFVVTDLTTNTSWSTSPNSPQTELTEQPGCYAPQTTSSSIAGDGRVLASDADNQITISSLNDGQAFGCQER